jgi:hypothetical protein
LKTGDVVDLRGARRKEVVGVLARGVALLVLVLMLVLVRVMLVMLVLLLLVVWLLLWMVLLVGVWWIRRRVLREGRGWLVVGWVVWRRERPSQPKREAGMTARTRHGDDKKSRRE